MSGLTTHYVQLEFSVQADDEITEEQIAQGLDATLPGMTVVKVGEHSAVIDTIEPGGIQFT
jgi:hypothetical protein